jgi:hypothetical protein
MATTTENSSMFTLEMLTKQAPPAAAEPEDTPAVSLPHVFTPVLAAPVVVDEKPTRVTGWVFVAAVVAYIAPVVTVVAMVESARPAPTMVKARHVEEVITTTTTATVVETSTNTIPSTPPSTSASTTPREQPNLHHTPRTRTVTTTTVKNEAPKCCPGENEMQCAMRRSVGATCG